MCSFILVYSAKSPLKIYLNSYLNLSFSLRISCIVETGSGNPACCITVGSVTRMNGLYIFSSPIVDGICYRINDNECTCCRDVVTKLI